MGHKAEYALGRAYCDWQVATRVVASLRPFSAVPIWSLPFIGLREKQTGQNGEPRTRGFKKPHPANQWLRPRLTCSRWWRETRHRFIHLHTHTHFVFICVWRLLLGTCHCGSCMCDHRDTRGLVTGRFCQCDDSECLDEDTGEVCGGTAPRQRYIVHP